MGYWVSAWNGIDEVRGASFSARPGAFVDKRVFPNSVGLGLPWRNPDTTDITTVSVMKSVLLSVLAWNPAWACLYSSCYEEWLREAKPGHLMFRAGWMTYLSPPYAARVSPPRTAIVKEMPGGALLIVATTETFTDENPAHVAVANEIQAALEPLQSFFKPL